MIRSMCMLAALSLPLVAGAAENRDWAENIKEYDNDNDGDTEYLIQVVDVPYSATGPGNPTVAWDDDNSQWVMYFETKVTRAWFDENFPAAFDDLTARTDPGSECVNRQGTDFNMWVIGRATSPNGITWTVDEDPALIPASYTFASCLVAQPDVVFDGTTWHMFFKAEQGPRAYTNRYECNGGTEPDPSWGCFKTTGVGYATSTDGETFTIQDRILDGGGGFGFPSVVSVEELGADVADPSDNITRWVLVASKGEIILATSDSPGSGWSWQGTDTNGNGVVSAAEEEATPILSADPNLAAWVSDRVFNPALTCRSAREGAGVSSEDPYRAFFGGRDDGNAQSGLGQAETPVADGRGWTLPFGQQPLVFPDSITPWSHWEAIEIEYDLSTEDGSPYIFYFTEKTAQGSLQVSLAWATPERPVLDGTTVVKSKICDAIPEFESDCSDGVDEDVDGVADCEDIDCTEVCLEVCDDDLDNDADGLIDCADEECVDLAVCIESVCDDELDNDGDGQTDCDDADCAADPVCIPEDDCADDIDNDGDGLTDCDDEECNLDPVCNPELSCDDGIDNDLDGATDCLDDDCAALEVCQEICDNDADDNGDELVDCEDPLCDGDPACDAAADDTGGTVGSSCNCDSTASGSQALWLLALTPLLLLRRRTEVRIEHR